MMKKSFSLLFCLAILISPGLAQAEKTDREKPIALEADRISVDDLQHVQTLEGHVVLTQGTLTILSDKIVITEDPYGFQHGVAFGGPGGLARFKQKRDGSETWVEGEGERIEYNTHTEVAELFKQAWVKSGEDQLKGDYIWYDSIAGRYLATSEKTATSGKGTPPERVRAVLYPKNQEETAPENTPPTPPRLLAPQP
ncbi:MAG: lipopolysaccharide transport periplasmic protein LptA [Zoogloeaceae bacterium]|nr:lipopolysaccharide transport periplasmic protein LptA [Zoogloeaceae bacterium]